MVSGRMCSRRKNDRDIYLNGTDCETPDRKRLALEEACKRCRISGYLLSLPEKERVKHIRKWQWNVEDLFSFFFILLNSVEMSGHNKLRDTSEYTFPYKYHYDFYAK